MTDLTRLHPQSWNELRQLVQLHGADAIHAAINQLEKVKALGEVYKKTEQGIKPELD